jgi:tetratricopeptide (TPR) repeat protein
VTPGRSLILSAALAALSALIPGCAAPRTDSPPIAAADPSNEGPAAKELRVLASRQADRPARVVDNVPPPPGLESLVAPEPAGADARRRTLPLNQAVDELAVPRGENSLPERAPPGAAPAPAPTPQERTAALRFYATGREKLLRGNAAEAIIDLRRATDLDPSAGEPWLSLGDAQSISGARAESLVSTEKAARLGAGGARPWESLGRAALAADNPAKAAAYLARAMLELDPDRSDPALASLIGIELGQALDALGYATAAVDSMSGALELLESVQGTQRFRSEIAAIARRRGDLWVRVGDLACRAGDFARAAAAYDNAWALPVFRSGRDGLPERRVFARLKTDQPALGAWTLFDVVQERSGWIGDSDLSLFAYFRAHGSRTPARTLASAIEEFARSKDPIATPALEGRLALARASLLAPEDGARVLRDHLARVPGDDRAASAVLQLARAASARSAAREALGLAKANPLRTEVYSRAYLEVAPLPDALAALGSSPAEHLLAARLLLTADRATEAALRIDQGLVAAPAGSPLRLGLVLASAEAGAACGTWDRVEAALLELAGPWPMCDRSSVLWATAGSLAAAQRFGGALDLLRGLADAPPDALSTPSARMDALLGAGELAARLSLGRDAERWLRRAVDADPYDERAHAGLLSLYGSNGALADQARFSESLRALRQWCPDGRLFRILRAQEMLQRGSAEEVLRQAIDIVRVDPADSRALDLVADAGEQLAAANPGSQSLGAVEPLLRDRIARAPDDPRPLIALARLLVAMGRHDDAIALLRVGPASGRADVSRTLERLLRSSPAGEAEADQMALARLGADDIGAPRSISSALELAEILQKLGRTGEALAVLQAGLPPGAMLTGAQAQALVNTSMRTTDVGGNAANDAALKMLDLAIEREVRLSQELHRRRLILILSDPLAPQERLLSAAEALQKDHAELGGGPYIFVLRALLGAEEGVTGAPRGIAGAMAFAEAATARRPDPEIYFEWFKLVVTAGEVADARRLIDAVLAANMEGDLQRLIEAAVNPSGPSTQPQTGPQGAAELAQTIGDLCSVDGRDALAAELYRLSLAYDPRHAWAANNLGYHLAETAMGPDGQINVEALDESERLLTLAMELLPDDGSVLDSLGWVRYRKGIFADRTDEAGRVELEGAVTLLSRAARTSKGNESEVILDHLGDALWRAGERDSAAGAWVLAENAGRQRLNTLRANAGARRAVQEVSDVLAIVAAKLAAVRAGLEPQTGWTTPGT